MADKTVDIILRIKSQGEEVLKNISTGLGTLSKTAQTSLGDVAKNLDNLGRNMQRQGRVLSTELTAPIIAFGRVDI